MDALLNRLGSLFGDVTLMPDVLLCPETTLLQSYLDAFASACSSEFECVLGILVLGIWSLGVSQCAPLIHVSVRVSLPVSQHIWRSANQNF